MDNYNNYLKLIENDIGNSTTTNIQLDKYCKLVFGKNYKGCFSLDNIPNLKNNQCCIFNLDKSHEPGSHWMGLYKSGKHNIIYDSFGRKSKKLNVPLKNYIDTEYDAEQKIIETNCGARCISFLCCCYTLPLEEVLTI